MANFAFPAGSTLITDDGRATEQFRAFLLELEAASLQIVEGGWANPTGTGSRASINANPSLPVSNPPTQAQVQAIATQVSAISAALAQLISDLIKAGAIS